MAVYEAVRGRRILLALEAEARRRKAWKIVLNARENVVRFYVRHDYAAIDKAETLFGMVRHRRMKRFFSADQLARNFSQ